MDPSKRASALILSADTLARQVCLDAGGDAFSRGEDVETILKTLRNYFQPDALILTGAIISNLAQFSGAMFINGRPDFRDISARIRPWEATSMNSMFRVARL